MVSLHCNLDADTKHLINAERLALMKPDAVLVNAARGPVIDETALVAHLQAHPEFRRALCMHLRAGLGNAVVCWRWRHSSQVAFLPLFAMSGPPARVMEPSCREGMRALLLTKGAMCMQWANPQKKRAECHQSRCMIARSAAAGWAWTCSRTSRP